jgi:hypothetical protein
VNSVVRALIARLQLEPLAGEGGYFRQTWRSDTASAILFLMTPEDFSALHRLAQGEIWHFYGGDCVEHVQFDSAGAARVARLGPDILHGDAVQHAVPAGAWQGARIAPQHARQNGWSLLGCTVSPPWDERGFELGARDVLLARFPGEAAWIHALTR